MRSLQTQLALGLFFSLVLVFFIHWWFSSASIEKLTTEYIITRLTHDAEAILNAVSFDEQDELRLDPGRLDPVFKKPLSGHYFVVKTQNQRHRSRSLWDFDMTAPLLKPGEQSTAYRTGPNNGTLLVLQMGFKKQNHDITVLAAEDLKPIATSIAGFQWWFGVIALTSLGLLVLAQTVLLKAGFRPVKKTQRQLSQLTEGEISELSADVPSEFKILVEEINRLLQMLLDRIQRSRFALGDLAHGLKTPLSLLMQYTHSDEFKPHPELREAIQQQLIKMQNTIDHTLKRARLSGQSQPGARFQPGEDVPTLVDILKTTYRDKDIEVDLHIDDIPPLPFDREDLLELLGNILDNAFKWSRRHLSLSIKRQTLNHQEQCLLICLEDDGTGIDESVLQQLIKRGERLDEAVEGYGLGLSIVKNIVDLYSGTFQLSRSTAWGGLKVEIRFPVSPTPSPD